MKRRSSEQKRYVKPLVEAVVSVPRDSNARMTVANGSATRKNIMEGIMMEDVITLETVFKREKLYGCATTSAKNVDGIIPVPQGLLMSGSVIQSLYVFQLIVTIGSCQEPLPIMGLMTYHL